LPFRKRQIQRTYFRAHHYSEGAYVYGAYVLWGKINRKNKNYAPSNKDNTSVKKADFCCIGVEQGQKTFHLRIIVIPNAKFIEGTHTEDKIVLGHQKDRD
jgi:hypothetical protein